VTNIRDHDICTAGDPLTRNAAQLLRRFGVNMGKFEAKMVAMWESGDVRTLMG
jgi:hypothetical protein